MPEISVRRAESRLDLEQCLDLRRSVLCGELHWPREAAQEPQGFNSAAFLAEAGPKPLGSARVLLRGGEFHLEALCVLPAFRRRGAARLLLGAAEAWAREQKGVKLAALAPEASAVFFVASGFQASIKPGLSQGWQLLEKTLI